MAARVGNIAASAGRSPVQTKDHLVAAAAHQRSRPLAVFLNKIRGNSRKSLFQSAVRAVIAITWSHCGSDCPARNLLQEEPAKTPFPGITFTSRLLRPERLLN
jgi:hypothetical protein